jgi:coenzyme PQQ precursor peptide PqqA
LRCILGTVDPWFGEDERCEPASVLRATTQSIGPRHNSAAPPALGKGGFGTRRCWLTALCRNPTLPRARIDSREMAMKWKTPVIIEIAVGLEINAYACAEVK